MAILEQHNRDLKVVWPKEVSPFDFHVIPMDKPDSSIYNQAEEITKMLEKKQFSVLFDDRNETVGVKFNDADLIGIRYRLIIGKKISAGIVEIKDMKENTTIDLPIEQLATYKYY